MVEKPKISVALCTYNGEEYLAEQLNSIAEQTLSPIEIVICDDGSTDQTLSVINKFKEQSRIPVRLFCNEERLGVTRNFRKAISLCKGNYIALSDQDDVWLKDKLEKVATAFSLPGNENIFVVFSDLLLVDEKLNSLGKTMWQHLHFNKRIKRNWRRGKALAMLTKYGNQVTGSSILFKTSFQAYIDEALAKPGKIWIHDGLIALAAARKNAITFIDEVTVLYRQHPGQVIGGGHVLPVPVTARLKKLWNRNLNVTREIDEQLANYKKHKEDLISFGFTKQELLAVDPLIDHLTVRKNLPGNRMKRIPLILKEWIKLRYYKYSGSIIMQAIKDWLVKRTMIIA
jgi:glycosyltransferase involved in cell wall biosynthesis